MPTYAYRCPACGHEFEKFHKINVKSRPRCPKCGTQAGRVITGGAGLLFKGSGFYITDYKQQQKGQERDKREAGRKAEKPDKAEKSEKPSPKKSGDDH
ncbi:MAG TPA: zinc ribbon domain-containing protein [Gemmatimonadales bacterium]|nr:zinc ribbon domain-containing protein [Gemmatimonadales bacterium]